MLNKYFILGTMVDMRKLGAIRSFRAELNDYMLQTGATLDDALKAFGIPSRAELEKVYTALNKAGDLVAGGSFCTGDTKVIEYSGSGYSVQGQCEFKGLTEFENAAWMPPRYVLADRFYHDLHSKCQQDNKKWEFITL